MSNDMNVQSPQGRPLRRADKLWLLIFAVMGCLFIPQSARAQVLGDPVDISPDFQKMENVYFVGSRVVNFDPATGNGTLEWARYLRNTTLSFNKVDIGFAQGRS